MMQRACYTALGICLCTFSGAYAQDSFLVAQYGAAVHSYFDHDYSKAHVLLTDAIESGFVDSRCYFFRGFSSLAMGDEAAARSDFREGAAVEAGSQGAIETASRALERIQGWRRMMLEEYRREGRRAARTRRVEPLPTNAPFEVNEPPSASNVVPEPRDEMPEEPAPPSAEVEPLPAVDEAPAEATPADTPREPPAEPTAEEPDPFADSPAANEPPANEPPVDEADPFNTPTTPEPVPMNEPDPFADPGATPEDRPEEPAADENDPFSNAVEPPAESTENDPFSNAVEPPAEDNAEDARPDDAPVDDAPANDENDPFANAVREPTTNEGDKPAESESDPFADAVDAPSDENADEEPPAQDGDDADAADPFTEALSEPGDDGDDAGSDEADPFAP